MNSEKKKAAARPLCQAAGCFTLADLHVVLKETEEPHYCYYCCEASHQKNNCGKEPVAVAPATEEATAAADAVADPSCSSDNTATATTIITDGFKLILYLCNRHENDFRYLINGSELRVTRRCNLHMPSLPQF